MTSNKKKHGFSLIELLVVIGVSSIILSFVFYLFNNVNFLTERINTKDRNSIELAYAINQLRDDVLHIIPGKVSKSSGFQLINGKKLIIHRLNWDLIRNKKFKVSKVTWEIVGDRILRITSDLGQRNDNALNKLEFNTNSSEVSFSVIVNKNIQQNFSSDVTLNLPEGINLFFGKDQINLFTSRVGQP